MPARKLGLRANPGNKTPIPKERPKQNYGKPKPTGRAAAAKQRKEIAETPSNRDTVGRSTIPTFSRELVRQNMKKKSPKPGPDWKKNR